MTNNYITPQKVTQAEQPVIYDGSRPPPDIVAQQQQILNTPQVAPTQTPQQSLLSKGAEHLFAPIRWWSNTITKPLAEVGTQLFRSLLASETDSNPDEGWQRLGKTWNDAYNTGGFFGAAQAIGKLRDERPDYFWGERFLGEVLSDPLNAVGWGVLGKVPVLGRVLGPAETAYLKGISAFTDRFGGAAAKLVSPLAKPLDIITASSSGARVASAFYATKLPNETIVDTLDRVASAAQKQMYSNIPFEHITEPEAFLMGSLDEYVKNANMASADAALTKDSVEAFKELVGNLDRLSATPKTLANLAQTFSSPLLSKLRTARLDQVKNAEHWQDVVHLAMDGGIANYVSLNRGFKQFENLMLRGPASAVLTYSMYAPMNVAEEVFRTVMSKVHPQFIKDAEKFADNIPVGANIDNSVLTLAHDSEVATAITGMNMLSGRNLWVPPWLPKFMQPKWSNQLTEMARRGSFISKYTSDIKAFIEATPEMKSYVSLLAHIPGADRDLRRSLYQMALTNAYKSPEELVQITNKYSSRSFFQSSNATRILDAYGKDWSPLTKSKILDTVIPEWEKSGAPVEALIDTMTKTAADAEREELGKRLEYYNQAIPEIFKHLKNSQMNSDADIQALLTDLHGTSVQLKDALQTSATSYYDAIINGGRINPGKQQAIQRSRTKTEETVLKTYEKEFSSLVDSIRAKAAAVSAPLPDNETLDIIRSINQGYEDVKPEIGDVLAKQSRDEIIKRLGSDSTIRLYRGMGSPQTTAEGASRVARRAEVLASRRRFTSGALGEWWTHNRSLAELYTSGGKGDLYYVDVKASELANRELTSLYTGGEDEWQLSPALQARGAKVGALAATSLTTKILDAMSAYVNHMTSSALSIRQKAQDYLSSALADSDIPREQVWREFYRMRHTDWTDTFAKAEPLYANMINSWAEMSRSGLNTLDPAVRLKAQSDLDDLLKQIIGQQQTDVFKASMDNIQAMKTELGTTLMQKEAEHAENSAALRSWAATLGEETKTWSPEFRAKLQQQYIDAWHNTQAWAKKTYTDYDGQNAFDALMSYGVPFWLYSSRALEWSLRTGLEKPAFATNFYPWGRYWTQTDSGYLPGVNIQGFQGAPSRTMGIISKSRGVQLPDYPSQHGGIVGALEDISKTTQAAGLYFNPMGGAALSLATTLGDVASGKAPILQLSSSMPPYLTSAVNALYGIENANYLLPLPDNVSKAIETAKTAVGIRGMADAAQTILARNNFTEMFARRYAYDRFGKAWSDLTADEKQAAETGAAMISLVTDQIGAVRYKPEKLVETRKTINEQLAKISGHSVEELDKAAAAGIPSYQIAPLDREQRQQLISLEGWKALSEMSAPLSETEVRLVNEGRQKYYTQLDQERADRQQKQLILDAAFNSNNYSASAWRNDTKKLTNMKDYGDALAAGMEENLPLLRTPEAKRLFRQTHKLPLVPETQFDQLLDLYYEIEAHKDIYGRDDVGTYMKAKEDFIAALPDDIRIRFESYIKRNVETPTVSEYRIGNRTLLKDYWNWEPAVINWYRQRGDNQTADFYQQAFAKAKDLEVRFAQATHAADHIEAHRINAQFRTPEVQLYDQVKTSWRQHMRQDPEVAKFLTRFFPDESI